MSSGSADVRRLVIDLRDDRPVWALPDWALDEIRAAIPNEWEVVALDAPADGRGDGGAPSREAVQAIAGAEVYFGHGFARELFDAAVRGGDRLRWVHSGAAGVAGALHPGMLDSHILLTNSAGIYAEPIAETVIGMILHFARGLDIAVRAQARGRWEKSLLEGDGSPVREVAGSTLGIVGYGGIGRAVARRANALGAQVIAMRRTDAGHDDGVRMVSGPDAIAEIARLSDFMVLALPETRATRGAIGRDELELLGRSGVIVNVGRGSAIDEAALVHALRTGAIRGAALDVFATEPLPESSPLWGLPNVLITPHVSGISREYWRRETDLIVANMERYLTGAPLLNLVDKAVGY